MRLQIWKNDVAEQIKLPNKRKPVNLESRTEQTVADKKRPFYLQRNKCVRGPLHLKFSSLRREMRPKLINSSDSFRREVVEQQATMVEACGGDHTFGDSS